MIHKPFLENQTESFFQNSKKFFSNSNVFVTFSCQDVYYQYYKSSLLSENSPKYFCDKYF